MPQHPSPTRPQTVENAPFPRDERERRHQLFLIETLVSRGCSDREIAEALQDDNRR